MKIDLNELFPGTSESEQLILIGCAVDCLLNNWIADPESFAKYYSASAGETLARIYPNKND